VKHKILFKTKSYRSFVSWSVFCVYYCNAIRQTCISQNAV